MLQVDSSGIKIIVSNNIRYVYVYFVRLTVDQAVDSAAFPIPHREDDFWRCCISVTTEKLSEDHSTSPTSPPTGSAAQRHLLLRTTHT